MSHFIVDYLCKPKIVFCVMICEYP